MREPRHGEYRNLCGDLAHDGDVLTPGLDMDDELWAGLTCPMDEFLARERAGEFDDARRPT